jgi:RND family efflux transporter MFP subunit
MVDPGAFVNQMMPIVEIINDSSVKVTIDVLEKDYHVVPKGTSVRIEFDALPGEVKMASITNTSPVVDRATGTAKAEINLDNRAGKLRTGMFARVQVIAETHKGVVLVPRDATLSEVLAGFGSVIQTQVFVVKDDRAQVRDVKLGLANATYFEVLEGLAPGDVVITTGQNIVRDGSKVRITGS